MSKLIIKDNENHIEPDVIYNGVNLADLPGVTRIAFELLPQQLPRLTVEVECIGEIDVSAVLGDAVVTEPK